MKFSDFVVREAILTDLQATTKEGAIREIVRSLHHAGALAETAPESITRGLLGREELGSTSPGIQGVACLEDYHPAIKRLIGTIALSRRGVEWDTLDGEPVDILFLLLFCCADLDYLRPRACQTVSRHVRDERFANRLRQAQTREQVTALLEEADQRVP